MTTARVGGKKGIETKGGAERGSATVDDGRCRGVGVGNIAIVVIG